MPKRFWVWQWWLRWLSVWQGCLLWLITRHSAAWRRSVWERSTGLRWENCYLSLTVISSCGWESLISWRVRWLTCLWATGWKVLLSVLLWAGGYLCWRAPSLLSWLFWLWATRLGRPLTSIPSNAWKTNRNKLKSFSISPRIRWDWKSVWKTKSCGLRRRRLLRFFNRVKPISVNI